MCRIPSYLYTWISPSIHNTSRRRTFPQWWWCLQRAVQVHLGSVGCSRKVLDICKEINVSSVKNSWTKWHSDWLAHQRGWFRVHFALLLDGWLRSCRVLQNTFEHYWRSNTFGYMRLLRWFDELWKWKKSHGNPSRKTQGETFTYPAVLSRYRRTRPERSLPDDSIVLRTSYYPIDVREWLYLPAEEQTSVHLASMIGRLLFLVVIRRSSEE